MLLIPSQSEELKSHKKQKSHEWKHVIDEKTMINLAIKDDFNDPFNMESDKVFIVDLDKNKKKRSRKMNVVLKAREELRQKGMLKAENLITKQKRMISRLNPIISQIPGLKSLQIEEQKENVKIKQQEVTLAERLKRGIMRKIEELKQIETKTQNIMGSSYLLSK